MNMHIISESVAMLLTKNDHHHYHHHRHRGNLIRRQLTMLTGANNVNKKLSCRRETETARSFMSLNILLSHSRSLKIIRNDTVE